MEKQTTAQMFMSPAESFLEKKNTGTVEAQFVAQEIPRRCQTEYPLAAETILQSTYMDDSLDSVKGDAKRIELYCELSELWAKAGMRVRR